MIDWPSVTYSFVSEWIMRSWFAFPCPVGGEGRASASDGRSGKTAGRAWGSHCRDDE